VSFGRPAKDLGGVADHHHPSDRTTWVCRVVPQLHRDLLADSGQDRRLGHHWFTVGHDLPGRTGYMSNEDLA